MAQSKQDLISKQVLDAAGALYGGHGAASASSALQKTVEFAVTYGRQNKGVYTELATNLSKFMV